MSIHPIPCHISVIPGHYLCRAKDVASCMLTPRVPPSREPRAAGLMPRACQVLTEGPTRSRSKTQQNQHKSTISNWFKMPAGFLSLVCFHKGRAWEVARHLHWSFQQNTKSVYKLSICCKHRGWTLFLFISWFSWNLWILFVLYLSCMGHPGPSSGHYSAGPPEIAQGGQPAPVQRPPAATWHCICFAPLFDCFMQYELQYELQYSGWCNNLRMICNGQLCRSVLVWFSFCWSFSSEVQTALKPDVANVQGQRHSRQAYVACT